MIAQPSVGAPVARVPGRAADPAGEIDLTVVPIWIISGVLPDDVDVSVGVHGQVGLSLLVAGTVVVDLDRDAPGSAHVRVVAPV